MSKENVKENVVEFEKVPEEEVKETKENDKKDEKSEPKKDFIVFRVVKGVGRGIKNAGTAINGFVHAHPWSAAIIASGITAAAVKGYEAITGTDIPVDLPSPSLSLPEGETDALPELPDAEMEVPTMEMDTDE